MNINNYTLIKEESINEINSTTYLYKHNSGAEILYVKNDDINKVFSITFKTPPTDHTGIAHIMEHSVLAGSKKYPIKEPFNELAKSSLNTYLNAMTFADKTMYPVASCNDKDFFNLTSVYADAVFSPLIYDRKETFWQEGWHYSLEKAEDELKYNGIVYNEMKGAYSNSLRLLHEVGTSSLFDNCYKYSSGGNPDYITDLTYENFTNFHKRYYHPNNSLIYLYGDLDIEMYLSFLHDNYLSKYNNDNEPIKINLPTRLQHPVYATKEYSVSENTDISDKNLFSAHYHIANYNDDETYFAMKLLKNILLSTAASPLKQALVNANLGEDIASGFDSDMIESSFYIMIKNSPKTISDFEKALKENLKEIVNNGIDKKLITAIINKAKFKCKENDFGYRPKGLAFNIRMMSSWLYGGNVNSRLKKLEWLNIIAKKADTSNYFEDLVQKYFIENVSIAYTTLTPKVNLQKDKDEEEKIQLQKYKQSLSKVEINKIISNNQALKTFQQTNDTVENLLKIPTLDLADIKKNPELIPIENKKGDNYHTIFSDINTNGIVYSNLLFNTTVVKEDKLYLIGLLSYLLGKLSIDDKSYSDLSNEINTYLGTLDFDFRMTGHWKKINHFVPLFIVSSSALVENTKTMYEIITQIITKTKFEDKIRIKNLLVELKSRLDSNILSNGHIIAKERVAAATLESGKYKGLVEGLDFYESLKSIINDFDNCFETLKNDLEQCVKQLFNRNKFVSNITCEKSYLKECVENVDNLYSNLNPQEYEEADYKLILNNMNEGFGTSSRVNYNVLGGILTFKEGIDYDNLYLLSKIISRIYFMDEIRLKGGAYGFMCNILNNGAFYFMSYRDPNLENTFSVYDNIVDFISNIEMTQKDLENNIIGTINDYDKYLLPKQKGEKALFSLLSSKTFDDFQIERTALLNADLDSLKKLSLLFKQNIIKSSLCTVGNDEQINNSNKIFEKIINLQI